MAWQQYGESFAQDFPDIARQATRRRVVFDEEVLAELPEGGLVRIEGEPDASFRHAVILAAGKEAFANLVERGVQEGSLCAAGVRRSLAGEVQVNHFIWGFGNVGRGYVSHRADGRSLTNPLAAAFAIGDEPFEAGVGFRNMATGEFHLLGGAVELDRVTIASIPRHMPIVQDER